MSDNAYSHQPATESPKQPGSGKTLAIIGGVFALSLLVCCGGGIGLFGFGMNIVEEEIKVQLRDMPQVRQHLGEIKEVDVNFTKTAAVDGDENIFVYDVEGSKGNAQLTIDSESGLDGTESLKSVLMRLPSGEEIQIDLDAKLDDSELN